MSPIISGWDSRGRRPSRRWGVKDQAGAPRSCRFAHSPVPGFLAAVSFGLRTESLPLRRFAEGGPGLSFTQSKGGGAGCDDGGDRSQRIHAGDTFQRALRAPPRPSPSYRSTPAIGDAPDSWGLQKVDSNGNVSRHFPLYKKSTACPIEGLVRFQQYPQARTAVGCPFSMCYGTVFDRVTQFRWSHGR